MTTPGVVTLRMLAREAGFSPATVSRALRGDPRTPEATRLRIAETARSIGYRANPLASAFMAHLRGARKPRYTATMGFLLASRREASAWGYRTYAEHCRRYLETLGYRLEVFLYAEAPMTGARLSKVLWTRGIQGLIVPATRPGVPACELQWEHFATAVIGTRYGMPPFHLAVANHFENVSLAYRELRRQGCSRIGLFIKEVIDEWTHHRMRAGALLAQEETSKRDRVPPLIAPQLDERQFFRWMDRHRPDAVLTAHAEAYGWLVREGWKIPQEVEFANLHLIPDFPDQNGIDQQDEAVCMAAVDLVIGQLSRNERGVPKAPKTVMIDGVWRGRDLQNSA